jgi:phosphate transport system ATP-binding protein
LAEPESTPIADVQDAITAQAAVRTRALNLWYGTFQALFDVDLDAKHGIITSLIGPSGCGKSTLLRCVNRINERLGYVRTEGLVEVLGHDVYRDGIELAQLRKQVGMVFQRPNPLPISIRDNILFGHRLHDPESRDLPRSRADEIVEQALREVLLWDGVKDRLGRRAIELSLEEQQKLCIARLLPVKPKVILMDEPCSALDPKATAAIEDLIWQLRGEYTIILVTHNMAQARRASDECAFMLMGRMIEHRRTDDLFVTPRDQRTADYIEGRYG